MKKYIFAGLFSLFCATSAVAEIPKGVNPLAMVCPSLDSIATIGAALKERALTIAEVEEAGCKVGGMTPVPPHAFAKLQEEVGPYQDFEGDEFRIYSFSVEAENKIYLMIYGTPPKKKDLSISS